ncbi:MAG: NAD(+) synthase [Malacoplasma sp.]|nr:NAD(+) synthase [Malacoplasma sp.]
MEKNYLKLIDNIAIWIEKILQKSNTKGFVYGVSGGIDSALICAIASKFFANKNLALRMDIENAAKDIEDANLVIKHFKVNYKIIDCLSIFNGFKQSLEFVENKKEYQNAIMNLKARIRMNCLYYYAQINNYLVCGTSNAAELYTGYFTKFGDSGSDFIPLANLTKSDVYGCAKLLNVPQAIIDKAPSAGLIENQTDESELKVTYKEIDQFLNNEPIDANAKKRILELHSISDHKRSGALTPLPIGKIIK